MKTSHRPTLLLVVLLAVACGDAPVPDAPESAVSAPETAAGPQAAFWSSLEGLCGQAFEGRVVESQPPDPTLEGKLPVMHVRECSAVEIRIPFHMGEDRSRTWVMTRTDSGLRLKHDHRHEDGSEDEVTRYGGDTRGVGDATAQEFYADEWTASLLPASASNIWTVEVTPGGTFVYALRREDSDRRFRVEFDLGRPVAAPPPPWGG